MAPLPRSLPALYLPHTPEQQKEDEHRESAYLNCEQQHPAIRQQQVALKSKLSFYLGPLYFALPEDEKPA